MSKDYNIEEGLISKLLETKDILTFKDLQIKPYYFDDPQCRKAIKFINNYYAKNGTVPTLRVFEQQEFDIELESYINVEGREVIGTEENLSHWCDELRNKKKHNKICDIVEDVVKVIEENGDTEKAYDIIKKGVLRIESDLVETQAIDVTKDGEDRKANYLKRKENKGMIGYSMGIKELDIILKGMQVKQLITLIAKSGVGKAQPLYTPILTPKGFKPMGEISLDDYVIGEDGKPYRINGIFPQGKKPIYELTFSDGTKSRCSDEHLWKYKTTDDRVRKKDWRVDTLKNIIRNHPLKRGKSFNLTIPVCNAVQFSKKNLIVDPYVLGALLGDGGFTTDRISFTTTEIDILNKLQKILVNWGEFTTSPNKIQYTFKSNTSKNMLYRSIKSLNLIGTKSATKFIPKEYLYSSIEDRKLLLAGIFDTDGHIDSKGGYSITTTGLQLSEDIIQLCRSLGYRCTKSTYDRTSEGKSVEYVIRISTDDLIFTSEKHFSNYSKRKIPKKEHDYKILRITNIEYIGEEECQCISVDSKDHTYLCDDFIVTHNTWFLILLACHCCLEGLRVLFFTTEMSEEQIEDRLEAMLVKRITGIDFNYGKFKSGTLSKEQEDAYFQFLDEKQYLEPIIIETATGVSNVSAKIEQYKPHIVFVDGAYLMEDDRGAKDDWLRVAHITRDLKALAKQKKLPIVINSQADSTTSKKTGPELENIGFSKAIGHDSDVVMSLFRDEEMIEDKEMKVKILKQREGTLGNVMLNWDFATMNFSSIYADVPTNEPKDEDRGLVNIND